MKLLTARPKARRTSDLNVVVVPNHTTHVEAEPVPENAREADGIGDGRLGICHLRVGPSVQELCDAALAELVTNR